MMKLEDIKVPADVPVGMKSTYVKNYYNVTRGSGKLMLFAGDQKVEHLNSDFYGDGIHIDDNDPQHLFRIASESKIGCFAAQLGLISMYGKDYKDVQYLVKLNSKSPIVKTEQIDPVSRQWVSIEQVREFQKNSGLHIVGVGYTIYVGSEFESEMFREAAQIVYDAHKYGYVVVLWMYPRGKAVLDEKDPDLIAGATGIAACLGSDFVKVSYPDGGALALKQAVLSAGRTKVVCAGGGSMSVYDFLKELHEQIHVGGAFGNATGRNVHQKELSEAIRMCNAIYAITVQNKSVDQAMAIYEDK
jgi:fructose-bisphosphate aldolase / 6-deoxy-5-ketofructose 1-phosphate synthase